MMLNENAEEALERAEDRAVQHDRAMALAILADIRRLKPLGQHEIDL